MNLLDNTIMSRLLKSKKNQIQSRKIPVNQNMKSKSTVVLGLLTIIRFNVKMKVLIKSLVKKENFISV
jgi:hypothetical protein